MPKAQTEPVRREEKISIDTQGRILLFGRPVGTIRKGDAVVDSAYQILEVNRFLLPRSKSLKFQSGLAKKLERDALVASAHLIRRARVYQLNPEIDPTMRFVGYQELLARHGGIHPEDYRLVFDGDVGSDDPETVYRMLRDSPPDGYKGHPLTRSDVLELYNPTVSRCFYIDTFALKPVVFEAAPEQGMTMTMQY